MAVMVQPRPKYAGKDIRRLRETRGLSQKQAAELVGINWRTWVGYERDEKTVPLPITKLIDLLIVPGPVVPLDQQPQNRRKKRKR